ncbi:MAG: ferritin family protein [Reichenbachiella sp.]
MDIFEYALKMELDGEKFYRDLADKSTHIGFKKIFTMLADDEVEHYRILKELQKRDTTPTKSKNGQVDTAKNVFQEIKNADEQFSENEKQKNIYFNAAKIEDEARLFYEEQAKKTEDKELKMLFVSLAEEERKHASLLEEIGDFVGAPDHWDVDAESTNSREDF